MKDNSIRAEMPTTVKVLNAAEGLVEYVASSEAVDSGRDVILASGWTFDRLAKNPVFVDSHNYGRIGATLGRVTSWRVDMAQRALIETVKWAIDVPSNDLARLGFEMTAAGYLRACSIGAMVRKAAWRDEEGFVEALKGTRLSEEDRAQVRRVIIACDQYELSAVVIGANPDAVSRALTDGAVSESLLARCGFDTDDKLETLRVAGEIFTAPGMDDVSREAARFHVAMLMHNARKDFRQAGRQTGAHHGQPLGGGAAGSATGGTPAGSRDAGATEAERAERRQAWMKDALAMLQEW